MNIVIDTHSHTTASGHAYSTLTEMAEAAAQRGLQAIAITDHAPEMPGTCGLYYFENMDVIPRRMKGTRLLMGAEVNIMNENGDLDLPERVCRQLDIVVASIHLPCYGDGHSIEATTRAYVEVMKKPYVNIIGHPDDNRFPYDCETIVKTAKETGTLLEINNSSHRPESFRAGAGENARLMLRLCKEYRVPITTGSDAHVDADAGNFCHIQKLLEEMDFPEELVVTTDFEKLKPYLNLYKFKSAK